MEGMDPEEKARFKQQMAMQNDPKKMLGQLFGDGSAGSGDAKAITTKQNTLSSESDIELVSLILSHEKIDCI